MPPTSPKRWFLNAACLLGLLTIAAGLWAADGTATTAPTTGAASAPTTSTAPAGAPGKLDPRVKPGESFYLEFPDLPPTRYGKMTRMQVCIPKSYDPGKLYPLCAWMGGGDGTSDADGALVDVGRFIRIGVPFPKDANNPRQSNMVGHYPVIWQYQKTMLDELRRVVPNISPSVRIIGGFSNGGHTIAGNMQFPHTDMPDYFTIYVFADGGGVGSAFPWSSGPGTALSPLLKGRYACLFLG